MEQYHFTLRFDDDQHSLTRFNGLPAQRVGELLLSLSEALSLGKNQSLVLSEISGNCYAIELTTADITVHESMKVIHKKISENDFKGLNVPQRKYAQTLKIIIGEKLNMKAYDRDAAFEVSVKKIEMPQIPLYYYEIGTIYGIITSIGSNSLEGKTHIKINQENYETEITSPQEQALLSEYKKNRLRLSVRKKINVETEKIVSAELLDFEVLNNQTFASLAKEFRQKIPNAFSDDVLLSENATHE
jgi:hypothetical protein